MLVTQVINSFAKLFGKDGYLMYHDQKEAVYNAKEFLRLLDNLKHNVLNSTNSDRLRKVLKNRACFNN